MGCGIWTGIFKSLQRNKRVLSCNMEVFKGKKFTIASRWLRRRGPQDSHGCWSCLIQKNLTIKSDTWVGRLKTILALGDGNFNETVFKSSNARRWMLEIWFHWRIRRFKLFQKLSRTGDVGKSRRMRSCSSSDSIAKNFCFKTIHIHQLLLCHGRNLEGLARFN